MNWSRKTGSEAESILSDLNQTELQFPYIFSLEFPSNFNMNKIHYC